MNSIKKTLILMLIGCAMQLNAQTFPYYFSVGLGSYQALEGATSLNNGSVWDDPAYAIPIGFSFELLGKTGNTIFINDFFLGAYLTLNPGASASNPVIIAYGSDIADAGYMSGNSLSEISYKLTGDPGDRILKIEWENCGFYNEMDELGTNNDRVSFQLWLYEGSNDIEMRFGESSVAEFDLIHDDVGPLVGFINDYDIFTDEFDKAWLLVGDQSVPAIDTVVTNGNPNPVILGLGQDPELGRIYRFTTAPYVSVQNPSLENKVSVYPTLVNDRVYIRLSELSSENASIEVYNTVGQLVESEKMPGFNHNFSMERFPAGAYFMHIRTAEGTIVKKVIKQ